MPTYVYECLRCGERFELLQGINDPPRQRCPACRGKVRRVLMPGGGFIFKGSGFYITDYKRKDQKTEAGRDRPGKPKGAGASGTGKESSGEAGPTATGGAQDGGSSKALKKSGET